MKTFKFKACWRGTSLVLVIEAATYAKALRKAERTIRQMEGGSACMELIWIE